MPNIVEIGAQIKVENARLPLDDCLSDPLDRVMSCPLGRISKRSRLEVRLEDRFEYELERTLHHPIPDRRYRKNADFAPVFRDLLPPGWKWLVHTPDQFVPQRLEQRPYALRLDGLEGNPVYSRRTIVLSRHLIRCTQGLHLADVDVETPETPGRFSLRLDVYPPPQVLQIDGRLCHLVLACPYVGDIANGRAPSLHGHCSASSLLQTHPPPSRLRPISRGSRLYGLPCSGDFSPGRAGFSSCSACPCHRAVASPRQGDQPYRSVFGCPFCLRPMVVGSALGNTAFRGHNAFTFVTAQ